MSDLVPAKTLDDYLLDVSNQTLLTQVEKIGLRPLPFFNLLYELVGLVREGKPSQAIERLNAPDIKDIFQGGLRLYILHCVRDIVRNPLAEAVGWASDDPDYQKSQAALFVIDREYDAVAKDFPPDLFPNDPENSLSDRAMSEVATSQMINQIIGNMTKRYIEEGRERAKLEEEIELRVRQAERERLEGSVSEIVQASIAAAGVKRNPEHTLNRQVLALGFILKHLGIESDKIDKTKQAKFIEFLINKTPKDIYDALREVDDRILLRKGDDARYVISQFRELGLEEIARDIEETLQKLSV